MTDFFSPYPEFADNLFYSLAYLPRYLPSSFCCNPSFTQRYRAFHYQRAFSPRDGPL